MTIFLLILFSIMTAQSLISAKIVIFQTDDVIQGKSFTLKCRTPSLIKTVYFQNTNGTIAGSCDYNGTCGSSLYHISQDKVDLETILLIPEANRAVHEGTWMCIYNTEHAMVSVKVLTLPNTITINGLASDILFKKEGSFEVLMSCYCGCAHPGVTFGWQFISFKTNESMYSINQTGEAISEVRCSETKVYEYKDTMLISEMKGFLYKETNPIYVKCTAYVKDMVYTKPISVISLGAITFPDNSPAPSSLGGGAIAGILIAIGIVIFVVTALIYFVKCRKKEEPIKINTPAIRETTMATFEKEKGGGGNNYYYYQTDVRIENAHFHPNSEGQYPIPSGNSVPSLSQTAYN